MMRETKDELTRVEMRTVDAETGAEETVILDETGAWERVKKRCGPAVPACCERGRTQPGTLKRLLQTLMRLLNGEPEEMSQAAPAGFWFVRIYAAGVPVAGGTGTVMSGSPAHELPDAVLSGMMDLGTGFFARERSG